MVQVYVIASHVCDIVPATFGLCWSIPLLLRFVLPGWRIFLATVIELI